MLSQQTHAQRVFRLLMPGELISGHAKFENKCGTCHEPFKQDSQRRLCLDCHKNVRDDVAKKRGFHGRIRDIATLECKQCHTEHKGRRADIVNLDPETFDHSATDFPLRGRHRRAACAGCHASGVKHRDAPHQCIACHKRDEPHRGRLGKKCADCHSEQNWNSVRFDHHRRTGVSLSGRHREISCSSCHVNQRFKNTPNDCYACHKLNDAHAGRFGRDCRRCHNTRKWGRAKFDHGRDTRFALKGAHKRIACTSCHTSARGEDKPPRSCNACHKSDDIHRGRNGTNCAKCHGNVLWSSVSFDHGRRTGFRLRGRHARITCTACHRDPSARANVGKTCFDCHRQKDVHKGALGKSCSRCHNENGWAERIRFDHDITRFPLIGQHAVVPCEECHSTQSFKGTAAQCTACHRDEDAHKGRLGAECGRCHNPNGWQFWQFDHDKQTDFRLDGAHEGLACTLCHRRPVRRDVAVSTVCGTCHRRDDIHRGALGARCDQCHTTKSFRDTRFRR